MSQPVAVAETKAVLANPVRTAQKYAVIGAVIIILIGAGRRTPIVGPYVDRGVKWALG